MQGTDYKLLYQLQKSKSHELYRECVMLRQRIATLQKIIEHLNRDYGMKENTVKATNAPIKTRSHLSLFTKLAGKKKMALTEPPDLRKVVSAGDTEKMSDCRPEAVMFHLGEALLTHESITVKAHIFVSTWDIQMNELPEEFSSLSLDYIKELLLLNSPRAYSFRPFSSAYLIELHSFGATKRKFYLPIVISYSLKQGMYWPRMTFFLSNIPLDPDYLRSRLQQSSPINYPLLFSEQQRQNFLYRLFSSFSSRGLPIQAILLHLLLQNSLLVKCKSNIQLANFLFLVCNYTSLELPHVVSYNLTDLELLHVPSPFLFGLVNGDGVHSDDSAVVDLDKGVVLGLDANGGVALADVVAAVEMMKAVRPLTDENVHSELAKIQTTSQTHQYLRKFVKTMTYYNTVKPQKE